MLPKIDVPIYTVNLISTGEPVRFRPFLVKEQKLFLMAAESNDTKETLSTIRQVLKNCVLDEIDVDNLPTFDLEYLFMNLRARSVEEVVNLRYKCNNTTKDESGEEKKCTGVVEFDMNLLEIEPSKNPIHTNKIQLTENLGVCLKYPNFEMLEKYDDLNVNDVMIRILVDCVDYLYDKDQIYYAKDTPRQELEEFIDNLQQRDLEKFKDFFDTMPEIKKEVHFKCQNVHMKKTLL